LFAVLAAAAPAADRPEPSDDKILFEGPAPGEVLVQRPLASTSTTITGTILFVTKDAVFLRLKSGSVEVIDAPRNTIKYALANQGGKKMVWDWDPAKKEIKGHTVPVHAPNIPPSTASGKAEPKYLFFALERLQDRVDQAVAGSDQQLLKHLADRAEIIREHAEKQRADPRLVRLYADVADYIEKMTAVAKDRQEFLSKHMERVEENSIKDKEAMLRAEMVKTKGLGEYFRGAFPKVTVSMGRGWWGRPYGHAWAEYDLGGAMAGVATIIRGQQQYELEALRIRFAKSLLDKEKAKALDEFGERQKKMKDARLRQIADAGSELFGLPKAKDSLESRELAADLQAKNDFRSLLDVLESRASTERKGDDQANPYTLLDSYHTASQLKERSKQEQAEKLFGMAQKAVDAVRHVPADKVYDADRADILRSAAGLACMAGLLDSPDDSWRSAYSPKAAYAVRLLEKARTYNLDQGGQVREQLAFAMVLAGRPGEAVRLAEEIKGTRKGSVAFLITLARLMAIADNHKDALDTLQDAINLGYNDVAFLGNNPDFTALRRDGPRYTAFTKPQISAFWVVPKALQKKQQKSRFEVVNNSPFALTDVRLTLRVEIRGQQKALTFTKAVPQLEKGDKIDWEDVFAEPPERVYSIRMTIDTDQGKVTPERLTRK
jgi:hypothetical protein